MGTLYYDLTLLKVAMQWVTNNIKMRQWVWLRLLFTAEQLQSLLFLLFGRVLSHFRVRAGFSTIFFGSRRTGWRASKEILKCSKYI